MPDSYESISAMLGLISANREDELDLKLKAMHQQLESRIRYWPASRRRHHSWVGGYADHIKEVMVFGIHIFKTLTEYSELTKRDLLNFSQDDVILVAYIHDIDKLYRYKDMPIGDYRRQEKYGGQRWDNADGLLYPDESAKVTQICARHNIILTDAHIEALAHHHGGFSNNLSSVYAYMSGQNGMTQLSTLIHSADLISGNVCGYKQEIVNKINPNGQC